MGLSAEQFCFAFWRKADCSQVPQSTWYWHLGNLTRQTINMCYMKQCFRVLEVVCHDAKNYFVRMLYMKQCIILSHKAISCVPVCSCVVCHDVNGL